MRLWKTGPQRNIVLVRGEGNHVFDEKGKRYLDLQSGYWCNVFGYGNKKIVEPMQDQFKRLTNVMSAFPTKEINEAMNQLGKVLPPELDRISFLNSGSEAVDLALKIARASTGKTGLVVNERGYYGATAYTFSLCAAGRNTSYLPDPGELHTIPAPTRENCEEWRCLEPLKRLVDEDNKNMQPLSMNP